MLNNKYFIIIISIVLVISIGVTVALVVINKDDTPDIPGVTDDPIISDTPITPDDPIQIPVFLGNAELSEDRAALLDKGIIAEIERLSTGTPKQDESGNFLTDDHGILIYESNCDVDYTEMEKNLAVIINYFADKGYMLGVTGGYEKGKLSVDDCGHTFSKFEPIQDDYVEQAKEIVLMIIKMYQEQVSKMK